MLMSFETCRSHGSSSVDKLMLVVSGHGSDFAGTLMGSTSL